MKIQFKALDKKENTIREVYGINFRGYPVKSISNLTFLKLDESDYETIPFTEKRFELQQLLTNK